MCLIYANGYYYKTVSNNSLNCQVWKVILRTTSAMSYEWQVKQSQRPKLVNGKHVKMVYNSSFADV